MDTTEQYIKMCEKLSEFKERKYQEGDYFVFDYAGKHTVSIVYIEVGRNVLDGFKANHKEKPWNRDDLIWLPRQDQLQEMVYGINSSRGLLKLFWEYWEDYLWPLSDEQTSFEMLWLDYVMHIKYNQIWNGKEWV